MCFFSNFSNSNYTKWVHLLKISTIERVVYSESTWQTQPKKFSSKMFFQPDEKTFVTFPKKQRLFQRTNNSTHSKFLKNTLKMNFL